MGLIERGAEMSPFLFVLFLNLNLINLLCDVHPLKEKLITAGIFNHPIRKDHPIWVETLEAYRASTGDYNANLNCGSCINKVKAWLEK